MGMLDPQAVFLAQLGSGILAGSGPTRVPTTFGQTLGAAFGPALQGYEGAVAMQMKQAAEVRAAEHAAAQNELLKLQAKKIGADLSIQDALTSGGLLSGMDSPDKLELLGTRLAAAGHAGGVGLMNAAERMRKLAENKAALATMRSQPGMLSGVPTGPMVPGTNFTNPSAEDVPAEERPAFNEVLKATMAGQPATASADLPPPRVGGVFSTLADSPFPSIARQARALQASMDSAGTSVPAQHWLDLQAKLATQEAAYLQAQSQRRLAASLRPQEPLNAIIGPDGKPVLVPRSQAIGATPAVAGMMPANEVINPEHVNLHGEDYLKTLPQSTQNTVRGLLEYKLPLNALSTRKLGMNPSERQVAFDHAYQADPNFNAAKYPVRQRVMTDFTSGTTANNITALDQALNHMGTLDSLATALQNKDVQAVNQIVNAVKRQFGEANVTNYETAQTAVGTELMRVFRQVNASEQETKDWIAKFPLKGSPAQIHGSLAIGAKLLDGRVNALNNRWNNGMDVDTGYPKIMSPQARAVLDKLTGHATSATNSSSDIEERLKKYR